MRTSPGMEARRHRHKAYPVVRQRAARSSSRRRKQGAVTNEAWDWTHASAGCSAAGQERCSASPRQDSLCGLPLKVVTTFSGHERLLECDAGCGRRPGSSPTERFYAPRCPFIGYVPPENDPAWMRCCTWTQGDPWRPLGRPSSHSKEKSCDPILSKPK